MLEHALSALRSGNFVLVYDADNREHETDFVMCAEFVNFTHIARMRKDAGGLICLTVPPEFHQALKIPYLVELLSNGNEKYPVLKALEAYDIPYDAKSAFSITINHRKTFTGITDRDRALTISEFAKTVKMFYARVQSDELLAHMRQNFRSPGHVTLLNAAPGLLDARSGHTELATALMLMGGITPSAVICEMMGDDGYACSKSDAMAYAKEHNLVFLEGKEIIEAWKHEGGYGIRRL